MNAIKTIANELFRKENFCAWLYFFCVTLTICAIFQSNTTLSGYIPYRGILGYICAAVIFFNKIGKTHFDDIRRKLLIGITIFSVISSLYVSSEVSISVDKLALIYLYLFLLLDNREWYITYRIFRYFLIIQCVLGAICYLSFVFNLGLPYEISEYYSRAPGQFYVNYKVAYLALLGNDEYLRLCGLFNEPGIFGSTISILLMADKYDLRKKSNLAMIPALIMTWSLAATAITAAYFVIRFYKSKWVMVSVVSLLIAVYGILPNIKTDNVNLQHLIERTQVDQNEKFGNRTSDVFDKLYEKQKDDLSHLIFGYGYGYGNKQLESEDSGNSSYKQIVLWFGWAGFLLLTIYLFLTAFSFAKGNTHAVCICLIWLLQRYASNNVYSPLILVVLIGGINYILMVHNQTTNKG